MHDQREPEKRQHIANEQTAREDIVPAEIKRRQQHESRSGTRGGRRARAGPLAKQFIKTCDLIVLCKKRPDAGSEQDLVEMAMRRIKNGSIKKRGDCHPCDPATPECWDR